MIIIAQKGRMNIYKEYQQFCEVDSLSILKHCQTRWLSLERCVNHTLNQWEALKSYFNSHASSEKRGRVRRVAERLRDPNMKLCYYFFELYSKQLNDFNRFFQVSTNENTQVFLACSEKH